MVLQVRARVLSRPAVRPFLRISSILPGAGCRIRPIGTQLANLGERLTVLVNDLQNERDATLQYLTVDNQAPVRPLWARTHTAIKTVQQAAAGIGGLPSNIEQDLSTVLADISPARISSLESALNPSLPPQDEGAVIGNYDADITDMIALADQVSQGVSNASLTSDVQALNALSLAKEQASEERGLINYSIAGSDQSSVALTQYFNPNLGTAGQTTQDFFVDPTTVALFTTAYDQEFVDEAGFYASATPEESAFLSTTWGEGNRFVGVSLAENLSQNIMANNASYTTATAPVSGSPLLFDAQGLGDPLLLSGPQALRQQMLTDDDPTATESIQKLRQVLPAWEAGQADKLEGMQSTELFVAGNIAATARQLQGAASRAALTSGLITLAVLLVVLLAALAVARSVVLPLRRLRAGALDIASVQLPERVRLLTESPDAAATMVVAPIDVTDKDEIGEVARAFDQVHAEAVRLAGEQALLRSTFNAMFVNLSRRSQALIERLARMIDNLEQTEADPDRLGNLFSMDHLVTRMRRNSENLLLLAGHESPRKWTDPVALADVTRAATSEIEQYNRVVLNVQPGVAVIGQAVSDVVHLLAELIENATIFSPKDTQVLVSAQELTSGGVLIEVTDKGIGVSESRLAEMNWRLDNPPVMDVSVSRHMGLFAVARLAERHRIRVRLRPAVPQGLTALVWLPDTVIERSARSYSGTGSWQSVGAGNGNQQGGGFLQSRRPSGQHTLAAAGAPGNQRGSGRHSVMQPNGGGGDLAAVPDREDSMPLPTRSGLGSRNTFGSQNNEPEPPVSQATSAWFRSRHTAMGAAARMPVNLGGSDSGNGQDVGGGYDPGYGNGGATGAMQTQPSGPPTVGWGAQQQQSGGWTPDPGSGWGPDTSSLAPGGRRPADVVDDPVQGEQTSAGLPMRVPKANLIPGSAPGGRGGPGGPGNGSAGSSMGGGNESQAAPLPIRSPEQARSRLSGFQRGARRAESQPPRAGEGTDR